MKLVTKSCMVGILFSTDELYILNQALNEVCNGLYLENFEKCMNAKREEVNSLLLKIHTICIRKCRLFQCEQNGLVVHLLDSDIFLLKSSLEIVCCEIDKFEFDTRLGTSINNVIALLDSLTVMSEIFSHMDEMIERH